MTINAGVTIEFSFGNVHITATGQAKQAGRIGDIINVYAFETHKLLPAVIIDAHTVRIQQGN